MTPAVLAIARTGICMNTHKRLCPPSHPRQEYAMSVRDLTGRTALVTGGASGIGAACARELASRGATVTIADVDEVAAKELAFELHGETWAVDLLDVASLEELHLDTDILVNNAGIQTVASIVDFDPAAFRRIQTLMVEAPFLLIRAVLPCMYSRGFGRIVNVSSVHGLRASE